MKTFFNKHLWWIAALLLAFAFMARGVVSEAELNRVNDAGKDKAKWTEYLVFKLAAARMVEGESVNAIELKGSLVEDKLGKEGVIEEREAWQERYEDLLHIDVADSNVYRLHEHAFSYPPLWAFLTIPLDAIGVFNAEAVIWHFLVMVGLALGARLAFLLAYDGTDPKAKGSGFKAWLRSPQGIGVSATVIAAGYLMGPISNQQNDSMVFALVMFGAMLLFRGRDLWAGVFFGLAAFSKGPLLLLLPWLCFKRRWKAAAMLLVAGVGISLLPDLLFPANSGKLYIVEWYEIALKPLLNSGEAAASSTAWFRFNELNQSLGATLDRIFGARDGRVDVLPALFEISHGARKYLTYVLYLALLGLAFFITRIGAVKPTTIFAGEPMPFVAKKNESASRGILLEISVVMILALLLSPMTSPPHLCVLIAPLFLLLPRAWEKADRTTWAILALIALPMLFVHKDLLGKEIVTTLRFYGISVWVMMLILFELALLAHGIRCQHAEEQA